MGELTGMDIDQELSRGEVESLSDYASVSPSVGTSNSNVQVVVRVRPPSTREKDQGYSKCLGVDPLAHSVTLNFRPQPRTFTFDYVADEGINQEEIFQSVGKPITEACLQGYHCCLIAYGQTGAGKTFTMEGPDSELQAMNLKVFGEQSNFIIHEKHGLIPRILHYIFQSIMAEKMQGVNDVEYVLKCSYLQIYNEQVSDLLDPESTNLTIHEDAKRGMYVEGLQEVVVSTPAATYAVFRRGSENRHVGMTAMNMESSRSHSVFTLVVESQRRNDGGVMNRRTSRFYLVDLAGSERQKHSESAGIRLKEAGSINKSLSALGNVIKALVDISEGKIRHVPYRDSKLTFLLKDALGGNSKCTLVANVSPAEKNVDETLSTLKFAQRAKLMLNTAVVNEDMFGNPAIMGEEIRRLRLEIAFLRASTGSAVSADQISLPPQEVQSESIRVHRLEHILSQSTKRSLASERKTASEIKELAMRLEATQAICDRLDKTLQSHKMIIRLRENRLKRLENGSLPESDEIQDLKEEIEHLKKQIEHHPDVVRFKMELDLCRAQLDDYRDGQKDEESLQSQMDQIENLNQAIKIELQEVIEDKRSLSTELADVENDREALKAQLQTMEDQFLKLRDAVEKYRQEAEDAIFRQARAEEKLQDSTAEQNEVWRRCNLAEAQATELAQELALQKSQGEKMAAAFREQSKLQEDMFLELQNATLERDEAKKALGEAERKLADSVVLRVELENRLQELDLEQNKAASSLEEMVASSEKLSAVIQEKDASLLEMKTHIESVESSLKAAQDKITTVSAENEAAELEKKLAVEKSIDLEQQLEDAISDRRRAEALVAEIERRQEEVERKAEEIVAGVTKLLLEKEEASMNRTLDLLSGVDMRQQAVEQKFEEITSCFESEANKIEGDIRKFSQELEQQIYVASCVEAAEAQCKNLEERNMSLFGENVGLHDTIQSLELKVQEQREKAMDLQRQLDEARFQQQATAQQLFAITADYQTVMQSFSEKHVVDITVDRGATPLQEEEMASSLANMAASNASKETDLKFVADQAESTPLKCQVHVQEEPDVKSSPSLHPGVHIANLEATSLSTAMNHCEGAEPSAEIHVGAVHYEEVDAVHPRNVGSAALGEISSHHGQAACQFLVGDDVAVLQVEGNGMEYMDWALSVQGIAPKLALPEFAVDSQNVGPNLSAGKIEVRGASIPQKRCDDQKRELVLLDMNRLGEDLEMEAIMKDARTAIFNKEASLEDAGLTLGTSMIDNYGTQGKLVGRGHKQSRNEGLKYLSDLVKSAIQEIECQLRKHSEIFKPSGLSSDSDTRLPEATIVVSRGPLSGPCEDFQKNLAKYKETMRLWDYSRQKWEDDLVFMKNEMTQIEGFRTAYDDLIPRLQELVSAGEDLISASEQGTSWQQTNSSFGRTTADIQVDPAALQKSRGEAFVGVGMGTSTSEFLKDSICPSQVQKSTFRPLRTSGKKVSSKFLTPSSQGPPVGASMLRPSFETERFKYVRMPTTAPPQTKQTVPTTGTRSASGVGASAGPIRRPLQPIHGNTAPNRFLGSRSVALRKKPHIQPKAQAPVEPLPNLPPSPKNSYKRRRLA